MKIVYAIATLAGTIIGVGFFALPYITLKVGFWVMLGYFLILGSLVILIHSFFGELSLKTPDLKRLPGFAKIYLGKAGESLAYLSTVLGFFGAILAYLIVGGEFLNELLSPIFGGSPLFYTFLYFALGALLIFFGIKAVVKVELFGLILFIAILLIVFFKSQNSIVISNLFPKPDWSYLFLPYGVILFSLWGGAALIPEIEEILGKSKKALKWVIPLTFLIPIAVYIFFIYLILGITGVQTTELALSGIKDVLGDGVLALLLLFGLLTTFTSFIAVGLTLKKVFWYDLKIKENFAWAITCFVPLILFLIGLKQFIFIVSFIGGVMIGIEGILILLMYRKIKPKNFFVYSLLLVFLAGIIYAIIYFMK